MNKIAAVIPLSADGDRTVVIAGDRTVCKTLANPLAGYYCDSTYDGHHCRLQPQATGHWTDGYTRARCYCECGIEWPA